MKVIIVDYGMGNVGSIANMIKKVGYESRISSDLEDILTADKLILPGVGSFDTGMKNLQDSGLISSLNQKVLQEKTPVLGICLGMQLMTNGSEEGKEAGLGWVDAQTKKFRFPGNEVKYRIPHMGWNTIAKSKDHWLTDGLVIEKTRFYFVHSYYVVCSDEKVVLLKSNFGIQFDSAFQRDNIIGVQFHPEKSHRFGMVIMKNFLQN